MPIAIEDQDFYSHHGFSSSARVFGQLNKVFVRDCQCQDRIDSFETFGDNSAGLGESGKQKAKSTGLRCLKRQEYGRYKFDVSRHWLLFAVVFRIRIIKMPKEP